jgi:hypothetical protein
MRGAKSRSAGEGMHRVTWRECGLTARGERSEAYKKPDTGQRVKCNAVKERPQ